MRALRESLRAHSVRCYPSLSNASRCGSITAEMENILTIALISVYMVGNNPVAVFRVD